MRWSLRALLIRRAGIILVPAALLGCGAPIALRPMSPAEMASLRAAAEPRVQTYAIEPGDTITINYAYHSEMNQDETVRPDGKITANLVGEVHVGGMTTAQLQQLLEQATSDRLRSPQVNVRILKNAERHVYVGGEVEKPGVVPYQKGLTALQAVIAAGGFRNTARVDTVVLVRTDSSGQTVLSRTLDLQEAVTKGVKETLILTPRDVLYVPRTGIAEANLWVSQHITELFPFFRGTSMPLPMP
jgi:protein involved in polysaccharide export with SLBB domain